MSTKATLSGNKLTGELERVIEKKPEQKTEVDKDIIISLEEAREILCEEVELEFQFNLHEEINEGKIPTEFEFYFDGENNNFF